MDKNLTLTIGGVDRLSPVVRAALGNLDQMHRRSEEMVRSLHRMGGGAAGVQKASQALHEEAAAAEKAKEELQGAESAAKGAEKALDGVARGAREAAHGMDDAASGSHKTAAALGAVHAQGSQAQQTLQRVTSQARQAARVLQQSGPLVQAAGGGGRGGSGPVVHAGGAAANGPAYSSGGAASGGGSGAAGGWSAVSGMLSGLVTFAAMVLARMGALFVGFLHTALDVAQQLVRGFVSAFDSIIQSAGRLGAGIAAALAAAGTAFGMLGIGANRFREESLQSLTVMLRSKSAAEDLFNYLDRLSDVKPFNADEIVRAGKELVAFGFDVRKTLPLVADVAFATKKPLEEVVSTLMRAKAGMFELREFAPLGITRESLQKTGLRFNSQGEPLHRRELLPAVLTQLQGRFGGAADAPDSFQSVSTTFTSMMKRVARTATEGFFGQFKSGLSSLNSVLAEMLGGGRFSGLTQALAVPFDLLGRAVEFAASRLPQLVAWLAQVVTKQNVVRVIAEVAGGVMTLGQEVGRFLNAFSGGKGFAGLWEGFQKAAVRAIDFVVKAWNALIAVIGVLVKNGPALWGLLAEGAGLVKSGIEAAVGAALDLVAIITSAKVVGFLAQVGLLVGNIGRIATTAGLARAGQAAAGTGGALSGIAIRGPAPGFGEYFADKLFGKPAGHAHPESGAAKPGDHRFDNPILERWRLNGQSALGFGGQMLSAEGQKFLKQLGELPKQLRDAIAKEMNGPGLSGLLKKHEENVRRAERMINGVLGPSAATVTSDGNAPRHDFGAAARDSSGAESTSAEVSIVDTEEVHKAIAARNAYFDSQIQMAKTLAASPFVGRFISEAEKPFADAARAAEEVNRVIPMLQAKQRDITEQLKHVYPEEAEYWELTGKQWQMEEEIQQLRQRGIETRVAAANRAQQVALDQSGAQVEFLQTQLKTNPFLAYDPGAAKRFRMDKLAPALIDKFRQLVGMHPEGETPAERLRRMGQAEELKGQILEADGLTPGAGQGSGMALEGVFHAQRAINRMWLQFRSGRGRRPVSLPADFNPNTGVIPLFNPKKARAALNQLNQIQQQAEKDGAVQAGHATVNAAGQVIINAPGGVQGGDSRVVPGGRGSGPLAAVNVINLPNANPETLRAQLSQALQQQGVTPGAIQEIVRAAIGEFARQAAPTGQF